MGESKFELKFNTALYSSQSIDAAIREYLAAYGSQIDFALMRGESYIKVGMDIKNVDDKGSIVDEFCNYLLYLNIK